MTPRFGDCSSRFCRSQLRTVILANLRLRVLFQWYTDDMATSKLRLIAFYIIIGVVLVEHPRLVIVCVVAPMNLRFFTSGECNSC